MMNSAAELINNIAAPIDAPLLEACHAAAEWGGAILTPLLRAVTFIGEKGLIFFALAAVLMLFKKTRRTGVCLFGAVCCGALIGNIILKDLIARPRPLTVAPYTDWWHAVGSPGEDGFSFPSGHVTAAAAGITALCLSVKKKTMLLGYIYVVLMAFSRCYLMAHYPSDTFAGIMIGAASAVIAFFIARAIFALLESRRDIKLFDFILEFDVANICRSDKQK